MTYRYYSVYPFRFKIYQRIQDFSISKQSNSLAMNVVTEFKQLADIIAVIFIKISGITSEIHKIGINPVSFHSEKNIVIRKNKPDIIFFLRVDVCLRRLYLTVLLT